MQTKKAKYHLKRIETILDLHKDGLTRLDRDILLEDIRRLYDLVSDAEVSHFSTETVMNRDRTYVASTDEIVQSTEGDLDAPDIEKTKPLTSQTTKDDIPEVNKSSNKDQVEEIISSSDEVPEPTESEHIPTTVTYENNAPDTPGTDRESSHYEASGVVKKNGKTVTPSTQSENQEEYEDVMVEEVRGYPELFDFKSSSELSDRLANSKIEQLNKILTINDKILYINHLFGGEAIPFQESLKKFENFYTYEEAKKYASEELVTEYNWTNKEKTETVRQFMRQVKRLYG